MLLSNTAQLQSNMKSFEYMFMQRKKNLRHTLEDQWSGLGRNDSVPDLSWPDYWSMVNPHGTQSETIRRRRIKDIRRWRNADDDDDEV